MSLASHLLRCRIPWDPLVPIQTHLEMVTGTQGPAEDGSCRGNRLPSSPGRDCLRMGRAMWSLCRTEQLVSRGAVTSLVTHLLRFALSLPLTLSYLQFCFPRILFLNKVLTYNLLLSLCFLEILGRDSSKWGPRDQILRMWFGSWIAHWSEGTRPWFWQWVDWEQPTVQWWH